MWSLGRVAGHHAVGDGGGELDNEAAVVADDGAVRPALRRRAAGIGAALMTVRP